MKKPRPRKYRRLPLDEPKPMSDFGKLGIAVWVIALLACVILTMTGCSSVRSIINPSGPKNEALISSLKLQNADLLAQVGQKDALLGAVAGNIYGVQQGAERVEPSKGKDIVVAEAGLASQSVGPAPAEAKAAADARILATLKGDLAEQKRLYGKASDEVVARNKDLEARDALIHDRDGQISTLQAAAEAEKAESAKKLADVLKQKDDALADAKAKHSKSLQSWAAKILIGSGIAVIIGCGAMLFLTGVTGVAKAIPGAIGGLLLIGSGVIVGQPWFLWVVGAALLALVIWGVVTFLHLKDTKNIATALPKAVQDLKDEAGAGVSSAASALSEFNAHLAYRIPPVLSAKIDQRLVAEGVNAK